MASFDNACLYEAVVEAFIALGKELSGEVRRKLQKIIEDSGGFPDGRLNELPLVLASIGPLTVFVSGVPGELGPTTFAYEAGEPIIVIRDTGTCFGKPMSHAEFGYASKEFLSGSFWAVILFREAC